MGEVVLFMPLFQHISRFAKNSGKIRQTSLFSRRRKGLYIFGAVMNSLCLDKSHLCYVCVVHFEGLFGRFIKGP